MKDNNSCIKIIGLIATIGLNVLTSLIVAILIIISCCNNGINLKNMYAAGILLLVLESFNIINLLLYYFVVKNKKLLEKLIDKK